MNLNKEELQELERHLKWDVEYRIGELQKKRLAQSFKKLLDRSIFIYGWYEGQIPVVTARSENVYVKVTLKKGSDIKHYMKWLTGLGWHQRKDRKPTTTGTRVEWRLYNESLKDEDVDMEPAIWFHADFGGDKDDPEACKLVQTGVKTSETPVYELICPDGTKPAQVEV